MAAYTVKQLSKLASVSVRTLHYCDEIGLLRPSRVGDNGYRFYEAEAVLRALEAHRSALLQRLGRLNRLVQTVDKTIAHMKGERNMETRELFAGFSDEQQEKYEAEAAALWGDSVGVLRPSGARGVGRRQRAAETRTGAPAALLGHLRIMASRAPNGPAQPVQPSRAIRRGGRPRLRKP